MKRSVGLQLVAARKLEKWRLELSEENKNLETTLRVLEARSQKRPALA